MESSLIDLAYEFVSNNKKECKFADIWKYVVENAQLSEEDAAKRISGFYTNLMLDGRFVTLGENIWDLRTRQTFDKVHIDMKDVYNDVEATDLDAEEKEDQDEYEAMYEEKPTDGSENGENVDGNDEEKEDEEGEGETL